MRSLSCKIEINGIVYIGVVDLEIQSSTELLTDTAKVTFPRKQAWGGDDIFDYIKRGDDVRIELGYRDKNDLVFVGIVRSVKADIPFTVICDDLMFELKSKSFKESFKSISLIDLLTKLIPWQTREVADTQLGKFRINNATPAKVLGFLKQKYGIYSYFKNETFYSGLQYWGKGINHKIRFTRDIYTGHSLEYRLADDISFQVTAISILEDNSRIEVKKGDDDGDKRTYHYFNIEEEELERRAEQELVKLKYDGYRGSFTTYGQPTINHGDTITLIDDKYPKREDKSYIVKAVSRKFGQSGYSQTVTLDRAWK